MPVCLLVRGGDDLVGAARGEKVPNAMSQAISSRLEATPHTPHTDPLPLSDSLSPSTLSLAMASSPKKLKLNPPTSSRQSRSSFEPSPSAPMSPPPAAGQSAAKARAKVGEVATLGDSDEEVSMGEVDESEAEFVYDSDIEISDVLDWSTGGCGEADGMSISEAEDGTPPSPPPELMIPKTKGISSKMYKDDISRLIQLHASQDGTQVRGKLEPASETGIDHTTTITSWLANGS